MGPDDVVAQIAAQHLDPAVHLGGPRRAVHHYQSQPVQTAPAIAQAHMAIERVDRPSITAWAHQTSVAYLAADVQNMPVVALQLEDCRAKVDSCASCLALHVSVCRVCNAAH